MVSRELALDEIWPLRENICDVAQLTNNPVESDTGQTDFGFTRKRGIADQDDVAVR